MIDLGIGFLKRVEYNLDVIMDFLKIWEEMVKRSIGVFYVFIFIGFSRKRFLGDICGRFEVVDRDVVIVVFVIVGVLGGVNIIRVYNVKDNVDVVKVCDVMLIRRGRLKG